MSEVVESADWCDISPGLVICGTNMVEISRESWGIRWCFHCRKRHEFDFVVTAPNGPSYYGPNPSIRGPKRECTDVFPGCEREWKEWD